MKEVLKEFKEFALKGNVIDVAIGMLIGSGVAPIASSLINDILMPPVGYILGNADLTNLFFSIKPGQPKGPYSTLELAKEAGAVTINYGKFINTIWSFMVITWVAFLLVKFSNKLKTKRVRTKKTSEFENKLCQDCLSLIPHKASRCRYCTSVQLKSK